MSIERPNKTALAIIIKLLQSIDFKNIGKRGKRLTDLESVVEKQNQAIIELGKELETLKNN